MIKKAKNTTDAKAIDFATGSFISNGNKYYLYQKKMGYERSKRFEQLVPQILIASTFQDHIGSLFKVRDTYKNATTDGDRYEAYNLLSNICTQAQQFLDRNHQTSHELVLEFCALFIVTENEDATIIDLTHQAKKISDWKIDMDMESFFLYCREVLKRSTKISGHI